MMVAARSGVRLNDHSAVLTVGLSLPVRKRTGRPSVLRSFDFRLLPLVMAD